MKLEWHVYRHNINAGKIEKFNVFNHGSFAKEVRELASQNLELDKFSEKLRHIAMYYFWSKCEHEVVITSWPPFITYEEYQRMGVEIDRHNIDWGRIPARLDVRFLTGEKIDIYDQLMLNWEAFVKYVKEHGYEIVD